MIAKDLIREKQLSATYNSSLPTSHIEHVAKCPKILMTLPSILSHSHPDHPIAQSELTPKSMAKAEIHIFKALDFKTKVEPQQACKWWSMKS